MIPTTTAVLVASPIALVVGLAAYVVGGHDPWRRRRVAADERAKARASIRAEYETKLAMVGDERDLEHTGRLEALNELHRLREERGRETGDLAEADAALGRIDALADRMGAEGRPTLRREIIAARRGCTLTEVELYDEAIA